MNKKARLKIFHYNFFSKNHKGLSTVVTSLILILLVLVAVGIIWIVIMKIISSGTEQMSLGKLTMNLEIKKVEVHDAGIDVQVKRNTGAGELSGIKFIVSDGVDTQIFEMPTTMGELATKRFTLAYTGLVKKVSIAPIFKTSSGKEFTGNEIDEFEFSNKEIIENLVVDGSFEAITENNIYTSDFSAGTNGWSAYYGAVAGNIDGIGGKDNNLRFTCNDLFNPHYPYRYSFSNLITYRLRAESYLPSGQIRVNAVRWFYASGTGGGAITNVLTTTDSWVSTDTYFKTSNNNLNLALWGLYGTSSQFSGGNGDVFYIRNITLSLVSFDNWIAGTGWSPAQNDGELTGKASTISGTASNIEQDIDVEAGKTYEIIYTLTRTAGSLTPEIGGVQGTTQTTSGTYTEEITATGTGNLKFKSDVWFMGTIDDVKVIKL